MEVLANAFIAAGQAGEDSLGQFDPNAAAKVNEKVTELDGVLVEVDAVSAIEERGLGSVLRNSVPTCYFLRFNLNEMSTENLLFCLDIDHFKRDIIGKQETAKWWEYGRMLYESYVSSDAPMQINIISAVRNAVDDVFKPDWDGGDEVLRTVFDESQKACFALLREPWKRFKGSDVYLRMIKRLHGVYLSDKLVRKMAVCEVLSFFQENPNQSSEETAALDKIVHDHTLLYLTRINRQNQAELNPSNILANWATSKPVYARVTQAVVPGDHKLDALKLNVDDIVIVDEKTSATVWKGNFNGQVGAFPAAAVTIVGDDEGLELLYKWKQNRVKVSSALGFLPQLFGSIVRSSSHIISYSSPPVASWILEGLVGSVLSVSQTVGVADSIASRVSNQKDIRWLQHCSTQATHQVKALTDFILKAYTESDVKLRQNNPNYLNASVVLQTLSLDTDVLRATKELSFAATPVIHSLMQMTDDANIGSLMEQQTKRLTSLQPRKTLKQSHDFFLKSTETFRTSLNDLDDHFFVFRSAVLVFVASLQIIEAATQANQSIQAAQSNKGLKDLISGLTASTKEFFAFFEKSRDDKGAILRGSLRDLKVPMSKLSISLDNTVNSMVTILSMTQNATEVSVPDSADQHADNETVQDLTKEIVGSISSFIGALSKDHKTLYLGLAEEVKLSASKVCNKVVFELTSLGVSGGIKKYEEITFDSTDLISQKEILELLDDPVATMAASLKEVAAHMSAILPKPDGSFLSVSERRIPIEKAMDAFRKISDISKSVADLLDSKSATRSVILKWINTITSTSKRFQKVAREPPTQEAALADLRSVCASILTVGKQLITTSNQAVIEINAIDAGIAVTPPVSSGPQSPFAAPVSPFAPPPAKPKITSPFETAAQAPSSFDVKAADVGTVRLNSRTVSTGSSLKSTGGSNKRLTIAGVLDSGDALSPLKIELNTNFVNLHDNVSKLWKADDIKAALQGVLLAVKGILSNFESFSQGQRNAKEQEFAELLSQWKNARLTLQQSSIELCRYLISFHVKKQQEMAETRRMIQKSRQEKHKKSSKQWTEQGANVDYEKWYTNCTPSILEDKNDDDIVMVETKGDDETSRKVFVKSGSLNGLVRILTSHSVIDPEYIRAFLITYRSFTTPVELLNSLVDRYNTVPGDEYVNDKQIEYIYIKKIVPIRIRISVVLKQWLESQWNDFKENDGALLTLLMEFLNEQMSILDDNLKERLVKTIQKQQAEDKAGTAGNKPAATASAASNFKGETPPTILCEKWFGDNTNLIDISPLEIARQVTLLDFHIFSAIQPHECLNQAWSKAALKDRAPNIRGLIKRSNDLTYYVATEILLQTNLEARQQYLLHFLQVAEHCLQLNSFNCVLAIYAGLSSSPIHRLKKTWEALELKQNLHLKQIWNRLEALTASESNHAAYRQSLHTINPPCVPFLGLYLTDLVFLDDGNADTVQVGDQAFINFDKRYKTCAIVREIQQYQQTAYALKEWPQLMKYLCRTSHLLDDNHMYKQSLAIEPRAAA